jgi:DNA sulfur modification protein DndD
MKLLKATVRNFGPFKGEQSISFPADTDRNVLLVFGANMRGKTSLLNALRWGLFGRALDRHSQEIESIKLINWDAQGAGDWTMSVTLEFEAEGSHFTIARRLEPLELVSVPRQSRDLKTEVLLKKDGAVLPADEVEAYVNKFIPEEIARFYLFDGELLQEYEALLVDDDEVGPRIKEAVEKVLGVPALIRGRDELRHLLKQSQSVQATEAKHVKALESHAQRSVLLRTDVEDAERRLGELSHKADGISRELGALDEELKHLEAVRDLAAALAANNREMAQVKERIAKNDDERRSALRDAWKDLLQPRISGRIADLTAKIAEQRRAIEVRGSLQTQIQQLESLLANANCGVCDSVLDPAKRTSIGGRLGRLQADLQGASSAADELGRLSQELTHLTRITGTGVATKIAQLERDNTTLTVRLTVLESDIEEQRDSLRNHDVARVSQMQAKRDGLLKLRGKMEADIEQLKREIDEKNGTLQDLSKLMSRNPDARKQRSSLEVSIYSGLLDVFGASIDALRERLRTQVADEATRIFKLLTTEKSYRELKINNNYGLTIVDRHGRDVSVRSAGAEQIVAMSLLCALNRTASRPGPVVIDTPFARLDPEHRQNILTFLPTMAGQVAFLVHRGEIAGDQDLAAVASRIGAKYDIQRVSSSESQLVKV